MRTRKLKSELVKELQKGPIITFACRKVGIARSTYYRWLEANKEFADAANKAFEKGREAINDLSRAQIISLIRDREFKAIKYWLSHNDPWFSEKLQLKGILSLVNNKRQDGRQLTDDEEALIKEAIELDYAPQIDTPEKIRIVTINKPLSYSIANHGCSC